MTRHYISEIDRKVNRGQEVGCNSALRRIQKYIVKHIDETFPPDEFMDWVNSDDEKPFRWNNRLYYWDK